MGVLDWIPIRKRAEEPTVYKVDDDLSMAIRQIEEEYIEKARGNGKAKAYEEPLLGSISMNPDYKEAPCSRNNHNLLETLKVWSRKNIIPNAIINTRVNQVSMFCTPARFSDKGVAYEVRLKNPLATPTSHDESKIRQIEDFLQHTGK